MFFCVVSILPLPVLNIILEKKAIKHDEKIFIQKNPFNHVMTMLGTIHFHLKNMIFCCVVFAPPPAFKLKNYPGPLGLNDSEMLARFFKQLPAMSTQLKQCSDVWFGKFSFFKRFPR